MYGVVLSSAPKSNETNVLVFQSMFQNFYAFKSTLHNLKAGDSVQIPPAEQEEMFMEYARMEREEHFMAIKGGKGYTTADIEALPEGERAELIDGEMFRMDTPARIHQEILVALMWEIQSYIKNKKGNCRLYPAPFGVYIKKDNRNFVIPDISVICDRDKLNEKGCLGAPDWAIEIVSPSSVKMDYERKTVLYREAGVREYWIVDSDQKAVTVYDFEHNAEAVQYPFSERIKVGIYEDLYLLFSEMDII